MSNYMLDLNIVIIIKQTVEYINRDVSRVY